MRFVRPEEAKAVAEEKEERPKSTVIVKSNECIIPRIQMILIENTQLRPKSLFEIQWTVDCVSSYVILIVPICYHTIWLPILM